MELLIKDLDFNKKISNEWIKNNCYIAGGACVSNFTRNKINDVDIYFKSKKARDEFINFYANELDDTIKYFNKENEMWKFLCEFDTMLEKKEISVGDEIKRNDMMLVAKCKNDSFLTYYLHTKRYEYKISKEMFNKQKWLFKNGYDYLLIERNHFDIDCNVFLGNKSITIKQNNMTYQFILRFFGKPKKMMDKTFDFQHCKIAYDCQNRKYIASDETYQCLAKRELKYVNSFYPISSLKRLYKYYSRGFNFEKKEFIKIIKDINKLNINNKFIIEDQMIGYYEDFDYNMVFNNENFWNLKEKKENKK